ncbi:MAG TPA: hypothetical protein VK510_00005, partial [Solirubrobacteraceae bacterium]|nr:hypothetical protein [Solirubrobacteraceae bacterium]
MVRNKLPHLRRRAGGELAGRAGAAEVRGEGVDAGLRQRAGAPGVLRAVADGGDGGGGGHGEHGGQDDRPDRLAVPRAERDTDAEARRNRGIDAREIARPELRHRTGESEAGDEPERQRGE